MEKKGKYIIILILFMNVFLICTIRKEKEFRNIADSGKIELAVYVESVEQKNLPLKNNVENYVFEKSVCYVNGEISENVQVKWDYEEWAPIVYGLNEYKTKCELFFVKNRVTVPVIQVQTEEWSSTPVSVSLVEESSSTSGISHYEYFLTQKEEEIPNKDTIATGTTEDKIEISFNGMTYIYYRAVALNGNVSEWSEKVIAKVDLQSPKLTMLENGTYSPTSSESIYSVEFGPSGGDVKCINKTALDVSVTTLASIEGVGTYTIECTARSTTGKEVYDSKTYTLSGSVFSKSNFRASEGASSPTGSGIETIHPTGIQYGPYFRATSGCYKVTYYGSNLGDTCLIVDAYQNRPGAYYGLRSFTRSNTTFSYYIQVPDLLYVKSDNGTGLEVHIDNGCTYDVQVSEILIEPVSSCPSS